VTAGRRRDGCEGRGRWWYVYRAIDQFGQVIDVFVSPRQDTEPRRRALIPSRVRSGQLLVGFLDVGLQRIDGVQPNRDATGVDRVE
jgi:hypothetical protein